MLYCPILHQLQSDGHPQAGHSLPDQCAQAGRRRPLLAALRAYDFLRPLSGVLQRWVVRQPPVQLHEKGQALQAAHQDGMVSGRETM